MTCPVEEFYQTLVGNARSDRTREALKLLHALCTQERQRPNPVLTVTHIGRLSGKQGGPGVATVRNRSTDYAALIHRHAEAARRPKAQPGDSEWLKSFGNPEQRSYVGALLNENRLLRTQLRAAKHLADRNAVVLLEGPVKPPVAAAVAANALSESERRTLADGLSTERLAEHFGWKEDELGCVVNRAGVTMLPVGFMAALRKVVERAT